MHESKGGIETDGYHDDLADIYRGLLDPLRKGRK